MAQIAIDLAALRIQRENLSSTAAGKLIKALNHELSSRYPEEGATHFRLDIAEVEQGRGAFYIASIHSEPVGCGAIRLIGPGIAEIKRMYVACHARGIGIAGKILMTLETEAIRLGANRLVLETGERQPEALALYTRAGYIRIPAFGEYTDSPLSVCMGKGLSEKMKRTVQPGRRYPCSEKDI